MINRRGLLVSLLAAPAIIRTPGLLMPVRPIDLLEPIDLRSEITEQLIKSFFRAFSETYGIPVHLLDDAQSTLLASVDRDTGLIGAA